MGSFTLVSTGFPQNNSAQHTLANGLNGTTIVSASVFTGSTQVPFASFYATGITSNAPGLTFKVSGDTGDRGGLYIRSSDGYGLITSGTGAGVVQSNWYAGANNALLTDFSATVQNAAQLDGAVVLPGLTISGSATVTSTISVTGTISAQAPNLASGGMMNTFTSGVGLLLVDDGTTLWWQAQAPANVARGVLLKAVTSGGGLINVLTANADGTITPAGSVAFPHGGSLSRVGRASASIVVGGGGNGSTTIAHGMGVQPSAGVMRPGDGGAFSGTFFYGYDSMGSTNITLWGAGSSGATIFGSIFLMVT